MLHQLHWQFKDGTTEMRAQRDINSYEDVRLFMVETNKDHPLPEDAIWMMCNDKSEHFARSAITRY